MERRGGRKGERAVLYGIVVDLVRAWGVQRALLALARGPTQQGFVWLSSVEKGVIPGWDTTPRKCMTGPWFCLWTPNLALE